MTPEMVQHYKGEIASLSQMDMCRLWRFAPAGHPYFVKGTEVGDYFAKAWDERGGFTPTISKSLGWGG